MPIAAVSEPLSCMASSEESVAIRTIPTARRLNGPKPFPILQRTPTIHKAPKPAIIHVSCFASIAEALPADESMPFSAFHVRSNAEATHVQDGTSVRRLQATQLQEDLYRAAYTARVMKYIFRIRLPTKLKRRYSDAMPGGTRFGRPSGPVTLAAVVVLIFILLWVLLSNLGWTR